MKRILLLICLLGSIPSFGQHWGLGIRAGDPTGITAKRYMSKSALEFNLGRSHNMYYRNWYGNHFHDYYRGRNYPYSDYRFIGYRAPMPLAFQVHYLFRYPDFGGKGVQGLEWYWGLGGQFRSRTYYYDYRYRVPGDNTWYYRYDEKVTDIDVGVDVVLGLEYTFPEVPLSVFADINLFMEVADDPFIFWPQSGVGLRYNFK